MGNMFCECQSLKKLDLSNFDISNVKDMDYMFYGCTNLKKECIKIGPNNQRLIDWIKKQIF